MQPNEKNNQPLPPNDDAKRPQPSSGGTPEQTPSKPTLTPYGTPQPASPSTPPPAQKSGFLKSAKSFASFIIFVVSVLIFAFIINMFIFQSYYVDGTSMNPTLKPNDRLIINKVPKTWATVTGSEYLPERGDIIVFNGPAISQGNSEQLIKRVIALPGEEVTVNDGIVTVYNQEHPNGFDVGEELKLDLAPTAGSLVNEKRTPVDEGEIYVMGDNRAPGGSYDSREFGPIRLGDVVGKLSIRILPISDAKFFW